MVLGTPSTVFRHVLSQAKSGFWMVLECDGPVDDVLVVYHGYVWFGSVCVCLCAGLLEY